ncbi:MAG: imidazole glycerol phosphate synthase subunit HisH [Steroidobacteraceae bacterium]
MRLAIIDNGGANVASLRFAFERLDCRPIVTTDATIIREATHVVLPGVGAAADAMSRLRASGLAAVIPDLQQPVLGICLGMQLLFEFSDEGGTPCLSAMQGAASRMSAARGRPVPHMGWNQLQISRGSALVEGIRSGEYVYFVHSYAVGLGPATVASCNYGNEFSAVVASRNFYGTQFHPERSAATGARLLANFLRIA